MRDRNDRNNDYNRRDFRQGSDDERMGRGEDQRFQQGFQGDQGEFSSRHDRDQGDFEQRRFDQDNQFQGQRDFERTQQRGFQERPYPQGFRVQQGLEGSWGNQGFQGRGPGMTVAPGYQGYQGYQDRGYQGSNYGGQGGQGGQGGYGGQGNWDHQSGRGYQGSDYGQQGFQGRGTGGAYGVSSEDRNWGEQRYGGSGSTGYGNQGMKGRAPRGYKRSDERIQDDICDRLMQQGRIDPSDIEVKVQNGEVTLTGTIESRSLKHELENLVDGVSGVQEIHNQLRIKRADQGQTRSMSDEKTSLSGSKTGQQATGQTPKNANESKREQERHAS